LAGGLKPPAAGDGRGREPGERGCTAPHGFFRVRWRMQPHEQDPGPKPKPPDPRDVQTKWLLLVVAVLLAIITSQLLGRLF
jgi:hypothetical protein